MKLKNLIITQYFLVEIKGLYIALHKISYSVQLEAGINFVISQ